MQRPSVCPCDWMNNPKHIGLKLLWHDACRVLSSSSHSPDHPLISSYHWLWFRLFHLQSIIERGLLFIPFLCPGRKLENSLLFSSLHILYYQFIWSTLQNLTLFIISEPNNFPQNYIKTSFPILIQNFKINYHFELMTLKGTNLPWGIKKELKHCVWLGDVGQLAKCSVSVHDTLGTSSSSL